LSAFADGVPDTAALSSRRHACPSCRRSQQGAVVGACPKRVGRCEVHHPEREWSAFPFGELAVSTA